MELYESGPGYSVKGYNFDDGTSDIIRCAIEVHKVLGPGFREIVYQRALALEFEMAGISYSRQVEVPIYYYERSKVTKIQIAQIDSRIFINFGRSCYSCFHRLEY